MEIKIRLGLTNIPRRRLRGIIPPTAGFARSVASARAGTSDVVRRLTRSKPTQSSELKVEPDKAFDEEFLKIPELDAVFADCLKSFPELHGIKIRATHSTELMGGKGKHQGRLFVLLFVPEQIWGNWEVLRPIIIHELCHFINQEDPDKVFDERADEGNKKLWKLLKDTGSLECSSQQGK